MKFKLSLKQLKNNEKRSCIKSSITLSVIKKKKTMTYYNICVVLYNEKKESMVLRIRKNHPKQFNKEVK